MPLFYRSSSMPSRAKVFGMTTHQGSRKSEIGECSVAAPRESNSRTRRWIVRATLSSGAWTKALGTIRDAQQTFPCLTCPLSVLLNVDVAQKTTTVRGVMDGNAAGFPHAGGPMRLHSTTPLHSLPRCQPELHVACGQATQRDFTFGVFDLTGCC